MLIETRELANFAFAMRNWQRPTLATGRFGNLTRGRSAMK
jgi:hypothetical protein